MNVELEKKFPLEHDVDAAWSLLRDIESVAGCMPGAEITEVVSEGEYKGKVKVKLGPVNMEFNGDIKVQSVDEANQQIHLIASGKDKKGSTDVSMDLTANVEADGSVNSALLGDAKVIVNGKLASFGQRMLAQVSDQILDQFAGNFRANLKENAGSVATENGVNETGDNPAQEGDPAVSASSTPAQSSESAERQSSASSGNEINGFKFAFNVVIGMIKGLFKRK